MVRKRRTKTKKRRSTKKKSAIEEVEVESEDSQETDFSDEDVDVELADEVEDEDDDFEEAEFDEDDDDELEEDSADANTILVTAQGNFEVGNYNEAQKQLVQMLDGSPSAEDTEQAQVLLGRMEMDVRTLIVAAIAMLTLLLIPTVGFEKALWTVPALFLFLLIDPRLFRSPDTD